MLKEYKSLKFVLSFFLFLLFRSDVYSQAIPDTLFNPALKVPAYPLGTGPEIHIDAAHHNYHTASDRFAPFARTLRNEGYVVHENLEQFDERTLLPIQLLVISNAIHLSNRENWANPTISAFTSLEIISIKRWVESGGRLLLIADHMPFAGATKELAEAFGFKMLNCFAMDNRRRSNEIFTRSNGSLVASEITNGNSIEHIVDSIITFTGSAFKIPDSAIPILKLQNYTLLSPDQAWQFTNETPFESSENFYQGAALQFGKGKIILMGEAAMFTAQIAGNQKIGMNAPSAKNNIQLLRNTCQWLLK